MERLTIADAAERLGVSPVTVRRRLKKGELSGEQEPTPQGYEWRVLLPFTIEPPPSTDGDHPPPPPNDQAETMQVLRDTIVLLRDELETRTREIERLHVLLSQQASALNALPARVADAQPLPTQVSTPRVGDDQASLGWCARLIRRLRGE